MSLIKLWNTIRGHSPEKTPAEPAAKSTQHAATGSKGGSTKQASDRSTVATVSTQSRSKPKLSLRDRFGGGQHAATCRLVKRSGAVSVLEIGVGDGERALAMTSALVDANPDQAVRYVAIDMFEMADGPITLKEFHTQLRAQDVQPTLVPMSVCAGLNRVSSTIGGVDLILIAEPNQAVELTEIAPLLRKITSASTEIYQLVDDQWQKIDLSHPQIANVRSTARRAA